MRIVLDTNVLIAGLLSPFGAPGEIVRIASSGAIALCFDALILAEYAEVLARPRFSFDPDAVSALLDFVAVQGESVASMPLTERLPDPDDEPFLEVALASGADFLVTGNAAHFPAHLSAPARVLAPAEFLEVFRRTARLY